MKNLKIFACVLLSFFFTIKTYSQGKTIIHFGTSVPVSDYASDDIDDEDAGGAAVGFNFGLQYLYQLSTNGIGIFGGLDFNYSGLKKDVKDDIIEFYKSLGINNPEINYYKYINVPATVGLNYTYQTDNKIGVFANAGLALNFLKITDMKVKAYSTQVVTVMDVATNFGFRVGGGILINDRISVSIDYYGLGDHDVEGKVKAPSGSEDIEGEFKIDFLNVTVGVRL